MKVSMHAARMGMQAHERTQGESAKATPPTWDSGVGNGCCCSLLAARTDDGRMGGEQAGPVPVRDSSGGTGRPAGREAELVVRR